MLSHLLLYINVPTANDQLVLIASEHKSLLAKLLSMKNTILQFAGIMSCCSQEYHAYTKAAHSSLRLPMDI